MLQNFKEQRCLKQCKLFEPDNDCCDSTTVGYCNAHGGHTRITTRDAIFL